MTVQNEFIDYEIRAGVAWLRFNRPEARNALTLDMYTAIAEACALADYRSDVHATVITGVGDTFSAGGDMKRSLTVTEQIVNTSNGTDGPLRVLGTGPGALMRSDPVVAIQRARKLVISAVNGLCQGGGFMMAMVSDLTIASDRATFRVPELLRGLADPWVASRLPLYVGMERAKHIIFRCPSFTAEQALQWGFVSEVSPHDELDERIERVLEEILLTGPRAREAYKAAANRLLPDHPPNHPDFEEVNRVLQSDEGLEGLRAFREKRPPSWVPHERAASSTGS